MAGIYHLQGTVKHYDWGGFSFIPGLLQLENPGNLPFAEYWLGTHPLGVSNVGRDKNGIPLTEFVSSLPFLLKVLDVRNMLSIQVHPSKKAAEMEFAKENAAGIPPGSPQRNYKDDNHKPEMLVALGDFWLLHGFKTKESLEQTLRSVAELNELLPVFEATGLAGLYKYVMELPQHTVNRMLGPLVERLLAVRETSAPGRGSEAFWVARAARTFGSSNMDRGIFSIYFFNIVHLKKGEGIFQAAGVPHAYLEGQNVEIMANSDNVLRGGLTTKHIDVPELLKHVKCEPTIPQIIKPHPANGELTYEAPVADFRLSVLSFQEGNKMIFSSGGPAILLVTEGSLTIRSGKELVELGAGHPAALVLTDKQVELEATPGAMVFSAVHNG